MKKNARWWAVYNQIVRDALRGTPGEGYYPTAGAAADAAFKALEMNPYEQPPNIIPQSAPTF